MSARAARSPMEWASSWTRRAFSPTTTRPLPPRRNRWFHWASSRSRSSSPRTSSGEMSASGTAWFSNFAFLNAKFENHAVPDALISPDEVLGEEERDRLEAQWNQRFRRGGSGRVVVGENALRVQLLAHSMGDLAALADMKATKEDICNSF